MGAKIIDRGRGPEIEGSRITVSIASITGTKVALRLPSASVHTTLP